MPSTRAKPHRKGLTRSRVVSAALDLVETHGLSGLSMRRLASHLGVEAMSLYTYFDTKHALELAMCDEVLAGVHGSKPSDDARTDAMAFAQALRRALLAHPNTARLFAMHMNLQDSVAVQTLTLRSLEILARIDADAETVLHRFGATLGFVVGHCLLEIAQQQAGAPPPSMYDPDRAFAAGVAALLDADVRPKQPRRGRRR